MFQPGGGWFAEENGNVSVWVAGGIVANVFLPTFPPTVCLGA